MGLADCHSVTMQLTRLREVLRTLSETVRLSAHATMAWHILHSLHSQAVSQAPHAAVSGCYMQYEEFLQALRNEHPQTEVIAGGCCAGQHHFQQQPRVNALTTPKSQPG